ncbi:MAG: class I SAM-dependent methyltransferase [Acidimicrobiia bacterium]|nr:class I SAM-dependent methyltransferase [Acidimicrobiia bacterium]
MGSSFLLSGDLQRYVEDHAPPLDRIQRELHDATAALGPASSMVLAPELSAIVSVLVGVIRPRFAVEVGTFTGATALTIALALPDGGRLLCCDTNTEWTDIGRRHWERAGVADRIDLRIAPAIETLRALPADPPVDFAFIDADKGGYIGYYEELLPRLSAGGMIVVDNVLWSGAVVDAGDTSPDTEALRAFNDHVSADPRSEAVLVAAGDGLLFIRRL